MKYLLITHIHSDHVKKVTLEKIKKLFPRIKIIGNHEVHQVFGVDIVANASYAIDIDDYTFLPFECDHNVLTYGYVWTFLEYNIIYVTDTSNLNNAPKMKYDFLFLESNHDEFKVEQILNNRDQYGYDAYSNAKRHLSTQQAKAFYYMYRRNKDSKLIELHQSSRFY